MLSKSTIKLVALLLFCQFNLTNCNVTQNNKGKERFPIINGEWSLLKFHASDIEIDQSFIPTLEIQVDEKKMTGFDGCNRMYASVVELSDITLKVNLISGTKVGCKMKEPYDEQYKRYLSATRSYKFDDDNLILFDTKDSKLLEFERRTQ